MSETLELPDITRYFTQPTKRPNVGPATPPADQHHGRLQEVKEVGCMVEYENENAAELLREGKESWQGECAEL